MAFRLVLNRRGVRELLRSPEVEADLTRRAENVAAAAGEGHEVEVTVGKNRVRASVRTESIQAMIREHKQRNLTRAIDRARQ